MTVTISVLSIYLGPKLLLRSKHHRHNFTQMELRRDHVRYPTVLVHKKVICKTGVTGIDCPGAKLPFPASKIGSVIPPFCTKPR